MSICCAVQVLEQAFFLLCQSVLVCLAWIATHETSWSTTIHGMPFGKPVCGINRCARGSGNLDLSRHSNISFVSASAVDKFGQFVAHPPRPIVRCTGLPAIAGVPDCLIFPFLPVLASGCAAACFLANASRSVSVNFLGSVILLFTSLVYSITKISLCVNGVWT